MAAVYKNINKGMAELFNTAREVFPELMEELDACTTLEQKKEVQQKHLLIHVNKLNAHLGKGPITADQLAHNKDDLMDPFSLTDPKYNSLISAEGDDIETQIVHLLDGIARLKKDIDESESYLVASLLDTGLIAIGTVAIAAVSTALLGGEALFAAIFSGIAEASAAVIAAIGSVIFLLVFLPAFYFSKPAVGIILLINDTDEDICFVEDFNKHGKPEVYTTPIIRKIAAKEETIRNAGFITTQKHDNAWVGTQYGVTYKYKKVLFQLAVGVPLTALYNDNNCYCAIGSTAEEAADKTGKLNVQSYNAKGSGIKVDIKVNSKHGSVGYYIARLYK